MTVGIIPAVMKHGPNSNFLHRMNRRKFKKVIMDRIFLRFMTYTKGRKEQRLVPFSNFRFIKNLAKVREWHRRSFSMTFDTKN
jgi:hypothetical protein